MGYSDDDIDTIFDGDPDAYWNIDWYFNMNKPNTEIKRWGIIVVQSLTPNDVKTGEILYHDVLQYKEYH